MQILPSDPNMGTDGLSFRSESVEGVKGPPRGGRLHARFGRPRAYAGASGRVMNGVDSTIHRGGRPTGRGIECQSKSMTGLSIRRVG